MHAESSISTGDAARPAASAASPAWIVHVTRPAQIGGTITTTLRQVALQHRRGSDVRLWSMLQTQVDRFDAIAADSGARVKQISGPGLIARSLAMRLWRGRGVVHFHSGKMQVTAKQRLLRRLLPSRAALVVTLHGPSRWERQIDDPAWRREHLDNAAHVDAIGVPSEAERRVQIALGVPADKVFVVPDVITVKAGERGRLRSQLGLSADSPVILFCGRVVNEKGARKLIEAFASIASDHPEATLVVAGRGPDYDRCVETARPLGDRIRFLGHVERVDDLYADADVFAAPSTGESFGISAMEAALAGCPMVLTRIEPWTDVFADGDTCRFVAVDDTTQIAAAISDLLNAPADARAMADRARQLVAHRYTPDRVLAALDALYSAGLRRRIQGSPSK